MNVVHITTVHHRFDTRIFHKECKTLRPFYNVTLVVADGKGHGLVDGVYFHDIGSFNTFLGRFVVSQLFLVFYLCGKYPKLIHLHDPELIGIGVFAKLIGIKVVFDAHEDFPTQLLYKAYIPYFFRKILSKSFEFIQSMVWVRFDAIIGATKHILDAYKGLIKNGVVIFNFPILHEKIEASKKKRSATYIGALTDDRGILQLIRASEFLDNGIRLVIGGYFGSKEFENKCKSEKQWESVDFLGFMSRDQVNMALSETSIGLVTLQQTANYEVSLPVKLFEYFSHSLPVIASDFPFWCQFISNENTGIMVDPRSPRDIADAINILMKNENLMKEMGQNGRKLVEDKCNWSNEANKLLDLYKVLLND